MTMRTEPLRVALAQINAVVGDIDGNADRIARAIAGARDCGAAVERIAAGVDGIVALVGFPERSDDVYNSAAVLADGRVQGVYRKMLLPNYGVFDEQRYFRPGPEPALIELNGVAIGLTICEDIWEPGPPATSEASAGAQILVNLSASPYHAGRPLEREQ